MDVLGLYRETGAYLEGHFLLASGRHSPTLLQSTRVLQYPEHALAIGAAIASLFREKPDFVIGPAMGGVILAFCVARALGCRALFAEKDGRGGMMVREAFIINPNEHFIAVEDVITTGGSLRKTIAAAKAKGGILTGMGAIINRGEGHFEELQPRALLTLAIPSYSPEDCPLCHAHVPLEEV